MFIFLIPNRLRKRHHERQVAFPDPVFNFANILRATFLWVDPKTAKIQSSHQYLFALLGSERAKAAHKMMVKTTRGVNFANI